MASTQDNGWSRRDIPAIDDTERRRDIFAIAVEAAGAVSGATLAALYLPDQGHLWRVRATTAASVGWTVPKTVLTHADAAWAQTILAGRELGPGMPAFILIQPIRTSPHGTRPCMLLAYDQDPRGTGTCALLETLALEVATELLILDNNPTFVRPVDDTVCGLNIADATRPDVPLIYVNDQFCRMTGYRRAEILGRNCRFLQNGHQDQKGRHKLTRAIAEGHGCSAKLTNYRKDGTAFTNQLKLTCVTDRNGNPAYFVGLQRDISHRRVFEASLARERPGHSSMLARSPFFEWRMAPDGTILDRPEAWRAAVGLAEIEADNWRWMEAMPAEDAAAYTAHLRQALADGLPFGLEYRLRTALGDERRYTDHVIPLRDGYGRISAWQGLTTDVTERREVELASIRSIYADALTGLLSWTGVKRKLGYYECDRDGEAVPGYLVIMDLRNLSDLNDANGYHFGDAVMRAVADRLSAVTAQADILGRLGGDTFALCLDSATHALTCADDAAVWAHEQISGPLDVGEQTVQVDAWIGVTAFDAVNHDPDTLMSRAQLAVQAARQDRHAAWRVYDAGLEQAAMTRIRIAHGLRAAITEDSFELMYQPKVDLATGRPVGAEALLRWHDPDNHMRMPMHFMQVAEASQLIIPIGEWVLRRACRQLAAWQAQASGSAPRIAVNISRAQLHGSDLPAKLQQILDETGAAPSGLILEITETALEREHSSLYQNLNDLRAVGVSLALDDFGIGYSSLSYLHAYPIDEIKIDKSFVQAAPDQTYSCEIVGMIVRIADLMGADVVPEGVETATMRDVARDLGCRVGQGFYYARPMPACDAGPLLLGGRALPEHPVAEA